MSDEDIERAAVAEILEEARKAEESLKPLPKVGCINKRLLCPSLASTLRNPVLPKPVNRRRYVGLDDIHFDEDPEEKPKRPDDGQTYDPSADYIYDARKYFNPEKYRKIVANRRKKEEKLLEKEELIQVLAEHDKVHFYQPRETRSESTSRYYIPGETSLCRQHSSSDAFSHKSHSLSPTLADNEDDVLLEPESSRRRIQEKSKTLHYYQPPDFRGQHGFSRPSLSRSPGSYFIADDLCEDTGDLERHRSRSQSRRSSHSKSRRSHSKSDTQKHSKRKRPEVGLESVEKYSTEKTIHSSKSKSKRHRHHRTHSRSKSTATSSAFEPSANFYAVPNDVDPRTYDNNADAWDRVNFAEKDRSNFHSDSDESDSFSHGSVVSNVESPSGENVKGNDENFQKPSENEEASNERDSSWSLREISAEDTSNNLVDPDRNSPVNKHIVILPSFDNSSFVKNGSSPSLPPNATPGLIYLDPV